MLQILLAFLAISIISVSGYGLVEQMQLQQVMVDQRENMRRLDVAADAIQGKLVTMPGASGLFAPAPLLQGNGWSYMPSGLGGVNANVDGVPFVYCPIAPSAGSNNTTLPSPDGSTYGVQIKSGVVVASDLGSTIPLNAGIAAYRPVAFIISAGRGVAQPPSCASVMERNGRPYVSGGLVKIVSMPGAVDGAGTVAASTSDVYVADGSSGSGRQGDPASLDDALAQWTRFQPAAMTIHLVGDASVGDTAGWAAFASAMAASAGRLAIDGANHTISAPAGQIQTPGMLALSSLTLAGPTVVVGQGDQLAASGQVSFAPGSGGSGLFVQAGGRLSATGGLVTVGGAADNGVESAGDVVLNSAGIVAPGKGFSLALSAGGRVTSTGSSIGSTASRNGNAALLVANPASVTSDAGSTVAASASGVCWASTQSGDQTFAYSGNGQGSVSTVTPDPADPGLADPTNSQQVAAYQAYQRDVSGRQQARATNHSNFQCQ